MYVLELKSSGFLGFYLEKTAVIAKIGKSISTFNRKMDSGRWETEDFLIRKVDYFQKKRSNGNRRGTKVGQTSFKGSHFEEEWE